MMASGENSLALNEQPLRVAIVGCGNIAGSYAPELMAEPSVELLGVADLEIERAQKLAASAGCRAYPSLDALLEDPAVDTVVNLTTHHAHYAVSRQSLEMGKHAYSEKPLALTFADARGLVDLADARGRRLACAPSTFMAEAQQTAWKWIRDGWLGTVRVVYAEVNWGRIESWHPAPEAFYDVGVVPDVGVYPLSILTCIFGPARRVWAYGRVVYPERTTRDGRPFHIETPEFVVALVEFESGTVARLTASWYVSQHSVQEGIEFHGDLGSLYLSSWLRGDADVRFAEFGKEYQSVPLVREPKESIIWSRAVAELARAIAEGRPHRATGEHAAHLVEIFGAVAESMRDNRPVEVRSTFTPPAPMEWA